MYLHLINFHIFMHSQGNMAEIQAEIDSRLKEDGISAQCTDDEKLVLVWKLYLHTEVG